MSEYLNLGKYLKVKRVSAGFTQAELANSLGDIHVQFVSNWERGRCAPPHHCFQKLISVLSLSRKTLVDRMVADSKIAVEKRIYQTKAVRKVSGGR